MLGSTERRWTELFARAGAQYKPTTMVAYSNSDQSGCGAAQAAMGPFYCPTDQSIYIDPQFFNELSQRFGAPGDFAMAYVIAHEVGHHVQNLAGHARPRAAGAGRAAAGPRATRSRSASSCRPIAMPACGRPTTRTLLEPGDLEEGMRAAEAIGDDALQKQMQGRVSPESFTHGTSAQRMAALRTGLQTGDPAACKFN